MFYRLFVFL